MMQVVYNENELLHNPSMELTRGEWKPYVESPERLKSIKRCIDNNPKFTIIQSNDFSIEPILNVHENDYIDFLQSIYQDWFSQGFPPDACLAETFVHLANLPRETIKKTAQSTLSGKLGFYTADLSVTFMKDTWLSAYSSAQVVLTAAHKLMINEKSIYALCRPPGHHASSSIAAGYCYINNAAVAARFLQQKFKRVLILDIDYHHGNGTQNIFYQDNSVFYTSLHAIMDYPYFTGSAEERGQGQGLGYNMNVPLSKDTTDALYLDALGALLSHPDLVNFAAQAVIVSMGFDTWHQDPIGGLRGFEHMETYRKIGKVIKDHASEIPVLFVQEGGYSLDKLGEMVIHLLEGYLD